MSTKEITFLNYNSETGEYFTDTKTCTVVTEDSYKKGDLGSRDGQEHWYVVEGDVDLKWFNVRGDVHLILADGCELTAAKKTSEYSAVNVEESDSLTIYGQSKGTGTLIAKGGYKAAAIGGDNNESSGHITINGGTVEATGGDYAAAIGGGNKADGKNITINGGNVTANSGWNGAAIGGGYGGDGYDITITGGTVTADARDYGAGIGGGYDGNGHDITITGGEVEAYGGSWGAGIGGGDYGKGYNITIAGGDVTAESDYRAAGIGGGYKGEGHDITITGGEVDAYGDNSAGIGGGYNCDGYNITIAGGSVTAEASKHGAGIGGGESGDGYNITINGGSVTATGGDYGAGIGGGEDGEGRHITINSGTVVATAVYAGAGIGGGYCGEGYDITINGGNVSATSEDTGAAIGGGGDKSGHDITINDGVVTAIVEDGNASGIGSGCYSDGYNITINGGTVTASGSKSAGIGGQEQAYGITINGGEVTARGGENSAGIGSQKKQEATGITITGGKVTASGGEDAAGIGGGKKSSAGELKITGGDITATGGASSDSNGSTASGIGAGHKNQDVGLEIVGGKIKATGGSREATGIGATTDDSDDTKVYVSEDVTVKAGTSSASNTIAHTSNENIAEKLSGNRYVETELPSIVIDSTQTFTASATCTHNGGTVGNGGYYTVTATGQLVNADYFVNFDSTSTTGNGGAIYNAGVVSLANATFTSCHTVNGHGGAIYNMGGEITLTNAAFASNVSVYGGATYSGGAIYMNSGALSITGGTFTSNQSRCQGGAIVIDNAASATLADITFASNSSRDGGAVSVFNGTLTVTDSTLTGNSATSISALEDGLGGAFLLAQNGVLNLANVTFDGNTATVGGAIYGEAGSIITLVGDVFLKTASDTIVTAGTLNWDLTGKNGSTGYLDDYALVSVDGKRTITVNVTKSCARYVLASNATSANGTDFILTGVDGLDDETITVGGEAVVFNSVLYNLVLEDSELVLETSWSGQGWASIEDTTSVASSEFKDISRANANGGVFLVETTGNLTVSDTVFTNNDGKNGGAIYNAGTTALSGVTFNGNASADGASGGALYNEGQASLSNVTFNGNTSGDGASGAIYNTGTLTLNGAVTLATANDTITNNGELVWNITTSSCGYLSDWSKLTGSGTFTITGNKDNRCGKYVLAGNAAAAAGTTFTIKGNSVEQSIVVNGEAITLNSNYNALLTVNSDNELLLTVDAKHIEVASGETYTLQDGTSLDMSAKGNIDASGGIFRISAGGTLTNDGYAKIAGSSVTGNGGVIYSEGTITLSHVTFSGNHSDANGGVIYSLGDVTITDSIFESNSANGTGSAIEQGTGVLTLTNVTFKWNSSYDGGAIHNGGIGNGNSIVNLDNVEFYGNYTQYGGAAIVNTGCGTIRLLGYVSLAGGSDVISLYSNSKLVWVLDGDKYGSLSSYRISGSLNKDTMHIDATKASSLTSYVLIGNAAKADGKTFTMGNTTISVNGSVVKEGDKYYTLYLDGNDDLRLSITTRTDVDGVVAQFDEGLVFTNESVLYDGNGGAIEVKNNGSLTIENTDKTAMICNLCSAGGNGGAICVTNGNATIANAMFSGNHATASGGAVCVKAGSAELSSVAFSLNNVTIGNGGAVCVDTGIATISDAVFSMNNAVNGGALYVGSRATVTISDATFTLNKAEVGGAIYIAVGGTLNVEGTLTLSTSTDTICNNGTLNWFVSAEEAERCGYTLCDSALLSGSGAFIITIDDGEETQDSRSGADTYTLADNDGTTARNFIIKTKTGKTIGTIGEGDTLQYGDSYLGLVVEDGQLKLSIVDKPTDLAGDADSVSWETTAEKSMMMISGDVPEKTLTLVTEDKGVNFYALAEGSYDVKVKNSLGNTWSDAIEITAEQSAETPTAWISKANGNTDLFFANASGVWKDGYVARHRGSIDDWDGTLEKVSIAGKNKLADTFSGSTRYSSVLVLTDDANGDALFVDDIYTAFPDDAQARVAEIKEIRAGNGDDVVDMTSQRFDYRGHGIVIHGGSGNDVIWANKGQNYLFGDAGDDRIVGASGNDIVVGGIGNDSMQGGGGDDVFCFGPSWGNDTVEQLANGTVTLWFTSGSEDNWNQTTMTYTDGANTVTVKGVSEVTLKFGDADKAYEQLAAAGAFADITSDTTLDTKQMGLLALV